MKPKPSDSKQKTEPRCYVWGAAAFVHAFMALCMQHNHVALAINLAMAVAWSLFLWIYAPTVPD